MIRRVVVALALIVCGGPLALALSAPSDAAAACAPGTIAGAGKNMGKCINPCPAPMRLNADNMCAVAVAKASFAGTWITRTSVGGDYVLTLKAGKNGMITGTFVEKDPQYNGVLQGKVNATGDKFDYAYTQVVSGATGAGSFKLSVDGKSIDRSLIDDSDPSTVYTWQGTRQ